MSEAKPPLATPIRLRRFTWLLIICWTAAIGAVLAWEIADEREQAFEIALSRARGAWEKEAAVRRWDAANGGIYVPVNNRTQPDPLLSHLPERDVTTPSGRKLTLVNPAAIIRNIQKATQEEFKVQGHITSLRPVDPHNVADAWEKEALEAFERGSPEVHAVQMIGEEPYVRLMRPLITEQSCLKCHAEQEYKVGDIRGGISVSVPLSSAWPSQREQTVHRAIGYGGMWLLGLTGIVVLSGQLRRQVDRRYQAECQLQETNNLLEQRVADRTAELASVNEKLQKEIAERKHAEQWLLESEQRFRGCFEQGLVGMAILAANQEVVEVNQRLSRLLGYLPEELIGKAWAELTPPEDRPAEQSYFRQMLEGARGRDLERRFLCKNGKILEAGLSMQVLKKEDGTIDCVLVLVDER